MDPGYQKFVSLQYEKSSGLSLGQFMKLCALSWEKLTKDEQIQYQENVSKCLMIFSDISDHLDDDKCLVCYAKVANVIFLPCKHRVSCKDCCEKLQKTDNRNKCIKCRQDVEKFLL